MDLVESLRRVTLFERVAEDYLYQLADLCEERTLPPGAIITRQADYGTALVLLAEGEAIIHRVDAKGLRRPVGMVSAGEWFGISSLFLVEPRDATVSTVTDVRLWVLYRDDFQDLLDRHGRLWRQIRPRIPPETREKLDAPDFPWMDPGETVALVTRRHWLRLLAATANALLISALAIALCWAIYLYYPWEGLRYVALGVLGVYVLVFAWHYVEWGNDYFAVTNRRVTHRERVALLYESRDEAPIDRVQNVTVVRPFMGDWFDFGHVTIVTAAEVGSIRFDFVPHPDKVSREVFDEIERARAARRAVQRQSIREELAMHLGLDEESSEASHGALGVSLDMQGEPPGPEVTLGPVARFANYLIRSQVLPSSWVETDEQVIWRKHWLFLAETVAGPFVMAFVCSLLSLLGFLRVVGEIRLAAFPPLVSQAVNHWPWATFVAAMWGIVRFWWEFSDWDNDQYIITNERIIDVHKDRPIFSQTRRDMASLGQIQNVSSKVPSAIAGVFDFGDVNVQTAGGEKGFTFDGVPHPGDVQREIFRRMEVFRENERAREAARRRSEIAEWFGVYEEMRQGDPMTEEEIARRLQEADQRAQERRAEEREGRDLADWALGGPDRGRVGEPDVEGE